jgi:polysulfide reductase chain C
VIPLAEHFVNAPEWTWLILVYFFLAGLSGGSYVLGAMLRLFGGKSDERAARIAFLVAFPLIIVCPILLTADLGQPLRFWHMLLDSTSGAINFKYWSPMSLGVWGLGVYSFFAFISFVESLVTSVRNLLRGVLGSLVMVVGAVFALFVCAYTGVLLTVSNQPVWSDGWPLGGLFLASALSGAAALLVLAVRDRTSLDVLSRADRYFVVIEAVLVIIFLVTVAVAGTLGKLFDGVGILLWLIVLAGLAVPFVTRFRACGLSPALASVVVLAGVFALRAVVIFGAQG